ncbi:MAG: ACT domain-containing protein [Micropruina sp.]
MSLSVDDEPGVLAKIAAAFARQQVSISAVRQEGEPGRPDGQGAKLAILTHAAGSPTWRPQRRTCGRCPTCRARSP